MRLHRDILRLGWVSFLTDFSSEMIFSVFAVFFTTVAGASCALLGLIEGMADLSASSLNYLSGWFADRSGKRKWLTTAGYAFSTLAKLILLVSTSVTGLALFRVIERLGKGFRGPPRDAWLSSIANQQSRGYAFGMHKALDKSGAVLGPVVAYLLLHWLGESPSTYYTLFLVAFVPALMAVMLLVRMSEIPATPRARETLRQNWQQLQPGFKRLLLPAGVFALSYYSLGFILLKAHATGLSVPELVLLYALFNLTCVLSAPGIGALGDRLGRSKIMLAGYAIYAAINGWLVFADSVWELIVIFAMYGLFYAIEESQSKALIADLEPARRASAIGVYNGVTGLIYLPASLLAGSLWAWSPSAAFGVAAAIASLALVVFAVRPPVRG